MGECRQKGLDPTNSRAWLLQGCCLWIARKGFLSRGGELRWMHLCPRKKERRHVPDVPLSLKKGGMYLNHTHTPILLKKHRFCSLYRWLERGHAIVFSQRGKGVRHGDGGTLLTVLSIQQLVEKKRRFGKHRPGESENALARPSMFIKCTLLQNHPVVPWHFWNDKVLWDCLGLCGSSTPQGKGPDLGFLQTRIISFWPPEFLGKRASLT